MANMAMRQHTFITHILENRHEYGTKENTLQLLKICQKGSHMKKGQHIKLMNVCCRIAMFAIYENFN
jgi:hypothetical protein